MSDENSFTLLCGKTIEEYSKEFRIKLPEDLDTTTCRRVGIQIWEMHQIATFRKAIVEAPLKLKKVEAELAYNKKLAELNTDTSRWANTKRPASATLEAIAKVETAELHQEVAKLETESRFWDTILDHLSFRRKVLEMSSITLGIEAKLTPLH